MKKVRLGIIGVGGMGTFHAKNVQDGQIPRCELAAVCDIDVSALDTFGNDMPKYEDSRKLIRSGKVDAVLIATPHYSHTTIGIDALRQGLHVMVEKPISVHKADCERLIAAHRKRNQVFAAMFNQRTDPAYRRLKQLIDNGEVGDLVRVNWIITDWFRSETYYASGGWRATWAGEGGGVLVNQCPHQLDLLQWLFGMPKTVRGFCNIGRRHHIEVEDEVTAYLEYPNGATGVFVTTTGEAPGTNRLEIVGERGKLLVEGGKIRFTRNEVPANVFLRTSSESFAKPAVWNIEVPVEGKNLQHVGVLRNFVEAILDKAPLIAPAKEGIRSVELANAMLYSSLIGKPVTLPLDGAAFERRLKRLIKESKFVKKTKKGIKSDLSQSF